MNPPSRTKIFGGAGLSSTITVSARVQDISVGHCDRRGHSVVKTPNVVFGR